MSACNLNLSVHIDVDIGLIHNLVLQDLLDNVLQGQHADHVELGSCWIRGVRITHQAHVCAALLEHREHLRELCLHCESFNPAVENLDEVTDLHLVLGVRKHEVLCVEEPLIVMLVGPIDRDAAVAGLEDLPDHAIPQESIGREEVGILKGRHDFPHLLIPEAQCPLSHLLRHLALRLIHCTQADLQLQHLHELRAAMDGAHLMTQKVVQHNAHRFGDEVERRVHEKLHYGHRGGANLEGVASACGLREDLAKDDDDGGGDQETDEAAGNLGRQDRQGRVHRNVA
mmetsp:Transcript_81461/g.174455  ORF Transcript_81461/g.174455 Transcript_81461/m.174455 type:complete len:285 (+) Transcript_81461:743-1597(+)